jgi:hypothetical protein
MRRVCIAPNIGAKAINVRVNLAYSTLMVVEIIIESHEWQ